MLVVLDTCAQDVANSGGVQLYGGNPVDSTPGATLKTSGFYVQARWHLFEFFIHAEGNALFHGFYEYIFALYSEILFL